MDRDLLELLVAYGCVPEESIDGAAPAAPTQETPDPRRGPTLPLKLAVFPAGPNAGRALVVTGLAQAWARNGLSVLVVELDPADEVARQLAFGAALIGTAGQLLLYALDSGQPAEPTHTLLPGVDVIASDGTSTWDPDALAGLLRGRPEALAKALGAWPGRYDRVIFDVPAAPGALVAAAAAVADVALFALPVSALTGPLRAPDVALPVLGVALTGFDATSPPPAGPLEELAARGLLTTALPAIPGLHTPWDLIAGAGGRPADEVFARMAAELDVRWEQRNGVSRAAPRPVSEALPEEERPTVVDLRAVRERR